MLSKRILPILHVDRLNGHLMVGSVCKVMLYIVVGVRFGRLTDAAATNARLIHRILPIEQNTL